MMMMMMMMMTMTMIIIITRNISIMVLIVNKIINILLLKMLRCPPYFLITKMTRLRSVFKTPGLELHKVYKFFTQPLTGTSVT